MGNASKAGALYALIVFLIGFILGTIRVLLAVACRASARSLPFASKRPS